jgi:hypothetical protein
MHSESPAELTIVVLWIGGIVALNVGQHLMTSKVNSLLPENERFYALNRWGESTRLWKTHRRFFPGNKLPEITVLAGFSFLVAALAMMIVRSTR